MIGVALVLMVLQPHEFLDGLYTITLSALMVAAMLHHARVQQDRALQEAALRQALHTRLLRTSMQPHGLMNTLAVLQELIEQHPAQASQRVDRRGRNGRLQPVSLAVIECLAPQETPDAVG